MFGKYFSPEAEGGSALKKISLFSLGLPIFIETALFMLLGIADVLILGRYDDIAASSVNTANQAVSIATIVFTVISGSSAVLISQYLGADKKREASRIAAISIVLNLLFGLAVSLVFLLFSGNILRLIGASGEVLYYAQQYLSVVGGFIFVQAVLNAASVIIRNHGKPKITMYITLGMNILNAALDLIFVLGICGMPRLGVAGAAAATCISRVLGCAVMLIYLFKAIEKPAIFRLLRPFPKKDIGDMLRIGVPSALETFLYNLSQLVITSIVLYCLTDTELVTRTYVQQISSFFYLFSVSIGQASQIITGYYVGAKKPEQAFRQGFSAYRKALVLSLSMCTVGVLLRYPLMDVFTDNAEVIAVGANILLINTALEFGRTTNLVLIASLRGAGDVVFPTACAIFSMWVISVLGSYILAVICGAGIYGLWIAAAADECFRGVLMIWRWSSKKWVNKSLVK